MSAPCADPKHKYQVVAGRHKVLQYMLSKMLSKMMNIVSVRSASNSDDWTATLNVNGVSVPFNLDTGSQCNVISKETYNELCSDQLLDKSTSRLITYSGHKMIPCGQKDLVCEYRDKSYIQRFQVVDQSAPSILGRE